VTWLKSEQGIYRVVGAVAGVGVLSGLYFLNWKLDVTNNKNLHWMGPLSPSTQRLLKQAHLYSFCGFLISAVPAIAAQYLLTRQQLQSVYLRVFCTLPGIALVVLSLGTGLAVAIITPEENHPVAKRVSWAASYFLFGCLTSPIWQLPKSFYQLALGYTAALTIPLSIVTLVSRSVLFVNLGGAAAMFSSVLLYAHLWGLNTAGRKGLSYLLAGALIGEGAFLLLNMNHVVSLAKSLSKQGLQEEDELILEMVPPPHVLWKKRPFWYKFLRANDTITLSFYISAGIVKAFFVILWAVVKSGAYLWQYKKTKKTFL